MHRSRSLLIVLMQVAAWFSCQALHCRELVLWNGRNFNYCANSRSNRAKISGRTFSQNQQPEDLQKQADDKPQSQPQSQPLLRRRTMQPPPVDDTLLLFGDVAVLLAVAQAAALWHVVTSAAFPGWSAPVTIPRDFGATMNEGTRLASCWLFAGAVGSWNQMSTSSRTSSQGQRYSANEERGPEREFDESVHSNGEEEKRRKSPDPMDDLPPVSCWSYTATAPELGPQNAAAWALRTTIDFSSALALVTLFSAMTQQAPVDINELLGKLSTAAIAMASWRVVYSLRPPTFDVF